MLRLNCTPLSHIWHNNVNRVFRSFSRFLILFTGVLGLILTPGITAAAYSKAENDTLRHSESYKVDLNELSSLSEPVLDWRNPYHEIYFEIPTSDWIDKIDLFISVHAHNVTDLTAPINIAFNNSPLIPIYPEGGSFEAHISLDPQYVRPHRNIISVRYGNNQACFEAGGGGYTLDLNDSVLAVKATTPSRPYHLRDVKQIFTSPLTVPKNVSLQVNAKNKLRYEALAAQGLALNMSELPRFTTRGGASDLVMHVGLRQDLDHLLDGYDLKRQSGGILAVVNNAPLTLVAVADTEDELERLMVAFAESEIPEARRAFTNSGEFSWQPVFAAQNKALDGRKPLYELSNLNFDRGWGNGAQTITFDVDNPLTAYGTADLFFQKGPKVDSDSHVDIWVNDEKLQSRNLKSKRQHVKFDIPRGLLHGTNNTLTIAPVLSPKSSEISCSGTRQMPGFAMESRSTLRIKNDDKGYEGDLTRFAASGYPFSVDNGSNSIIMVSAQSPSDRGAALRAIARLALSYGTGLTQADYLEFDPDFSATEKHILMIGPKLDPKAPKDLNIAVNGRTGAAKTIHTASLNTAVSEHTISLLAVRENLIPVGGVAALFERREKSGHLRGYLTNAKGHNFTRAMDNLVVLQQWNKLQGSMAQWDRNNVEMTRTAFDLPKPLNHNSGAPSPKQKPSANDKIWAEIELSPVRERIEKSGAQTQTSFGDLWKAITSPVKSALNESEAESKITRAITPDADGNVDHPRIVPVREPISSEPLIRPILNASTEFVGNTRREQSAETKETLHNFAPTPSVKPGNRADPVSGLKPAPTSDQDVSYAQPQYIPGASLRTEPEPKPVVRENAKTSEKSSFITQRYQDASGWIGEKINSLLGGPNNTNSQNRQANIIIFVGLIMFLLILLTLAKPVIREP